MIDVTITEFEELIRNQRSFILVKKTEDEIKDFVELKEVYTNGKPTGRLAEVEVCGVFTSENLPGIHFNYMLIQPGEISLQKYV